jgi:hypothetical protein
MWLKAAAKGRRLALTLRACDSGGEVCRTPVGIAVAPTAGRGVHRLLLIGTGDVLREPGLHARDCAHDALLGQGPSVTKSTRAVAHYS